MNQQADPSRWLSRALAPMLLVASATVPAGIPDASEPTRRLTQTRELHQRTAKVVEQAQVTHLAQRYRRPTESIRGIVRAAERAGARYDLPPALLLAIVETESSFNPAARSSYGARGLMQVVPRHHPTAIARIGGAHRLGEPEVALDVGARILADYVNRSGSLERGLHRYSGGANRYAAKVLSRQRALERVAIHATRQLDTPIAATRAANRTQKPS